MENRFKNHDQEKITGHDKQTVILDDSLSAETDELNPAFFNYTGPDDDEDQEDNDDLFPVEEDLSDDDLELDDEPAFNDEEDEGD